MILWARTIHTVGPWTALPRLQTVACESQRTTAYRHEGRFRRGERHCIFKYTLGGEGGYRDAAGEHRTPLGTGFLCEIRDPASAYYYPSGGTKPWIFVYASFVGEAASRLVRDLVERHGSIYALSGNDPMIQRLMDFANRREPEAEMTAAESARFVFDLLCTLVAAQERGAREAPANILVRDAVEAVRDRAEEDLNATDLARLLGVSREHLTRVFRAHMGLSPYQYIRRQKVLLACRWLKETTLASKEIAARLGYPAPAHFTRAFKAVMAMTPTEFRDHGSVPMG